MVAALVGDLGASVGSGDTRSAEVLVGSTGSADAAEEDDVGTGGGLKSELVEGHALAASLDDASAGSLREAGGADAHLGDDDETLIVDDGADNSDDAAGDVLALGDAAGSVVSDAGEGDDSLVDTALIETLEDDLVELAGSTTDEEAVELL